MEIILPLGQLQNYSLRWLTRHRYCQCVVTTLLDLLTNKTMITMTRLLLMMIMSMRLMSVACSRIEFSRFGFQCRFEMMTASTPRHNLMQMTIQAPTQTRRAVVIILWYLRLVLSKYPYHHIRRHCHRHS